MGLGVAVDLGTANTVTYVWGRGVLVDEPSAIALNRSDGGIVAVGAAAKQMLGRTPGHLEVLCPLEDGTVANLAACEKMLRVFLRRVVVCVPSRATELGRHAVQEAAEFAGARKPVHLIDEPVAAAIGARMPIESALGNLIVDVGGGTTEVAVLSLGGVVASSSVRIAGNHFDQAIMAFCRKEYALGIGQGTAEYVKTRYACAWPLREEGYVDIRGVDLVDGGPKTITVSTVELREAIEEPLAGICDAVRDTLEGTPPELVADASHQGLVLTGGGALLLGLDRRLAHEVGFPVRVARNPRHSVVRGAAACLETF
jgi:rod shape-determining protein MreB and related proteins